MTTTWEPLASLDATGLHLPDYPTILARVQAGMRGIYGDDLYLEPDSQDGQLAALFAYALLDAFNLAGSVYNSYSPSTAQGVSLARQVAINGLSRRSATYATVDLTLVGTAGTSLSGAVAKDSAGQAWLIPDTVIPAAGTITVTATAQTVGAVTAPAGDVTKMATPLLGWHSVTNAAAAVPGVAVELDAALRRRQKISTALPSRAVLEGIKGAVAHLAGVTRVEVYENDTDATDDNGIPAHSICLVVEGGDEAAIAAVVAAKKTSGTGTYGDVAVATTDRYGSPVIIRFYRPVIVPIHGLLTVRPLAGYLSRTGDAARVGVVAAINGLRIGQNVLLSKLYTPINAAEPDAGTRTFDVDGLTLGTSAEALATANVAIAFNGAATATTETITVEVAP